MDPPKNLQLTALVTSNKLQQIFHGNRSSVTSSVTKDILPTTENLSSTPKAE
jgi:hypothetical protein